MELPTLVVGRERAAAVNDQADWPADARCAEAVEVARQALLEEVAASHVGDPVGLVAEGPLVVTHYFDGQVPGYVGWRWAVTVTRAPDSDVVTVDETALLPDEHALLAPVWLPWKNRIQSGDLGAGDVLVTEVDDPRLVAGLTDNDVPDPEDAELLPPQWELGLGRERMLSPQGRSEAAHRWYREVGPRSQIARAADLDCATCGFLLLIGGPMGQAFGICANGFSPVDGRIVAMDFGCGAHSETVERPLIPVAEIVVDEVGYDPVSPDEPAEPGETVPEGGEVDPPAASENTPDADADATEPTDQSTGSTAVDAASAEDAAAPVETPPVPGVLDADHETMVGTDPKEGS